MATVVSTTAQDITARNGETGVSTTTVYTDGTRDVIRQTTQITYSVLITNDGLESSSTWGGWDTIEEAQKAIANDPSCAPKPGRNVSIIRRTWTEMISATQEVVASA